MKSIALLASLSVGLWACSSDDSEPGDTTRADAAANSSADAMPGAPDADTSNTPDGMPASARIPSWSLLDVNPESAGYNTTYGLDSFDGEILVAVLVQGF